MKIALLCVLILVGCYHQEDPDACKAAACLDEPTGEVTISKMGSGFTFTVPQEDVQSQINIIEQDWTDPSIVFEYPGMYWSVGDPIMLHINGWVPSLDCDAPEGGRVECRLTFESLDDQAAD